MKTQPPKLILKTALMAALSLAASGAFAAPICVKFVNSNNPGVQNSVADSLAPADVAGAPGFMHLHWNNMGVSGQTLPVADTSSNATGVTITWASPDTWHSGAGLGTPNEKLMSGYLDSTRVTNGVDNPFDFSGSGATDNRPDVYATGLSGWLATQGATSYSVVVYSDSDSTGGGIAEYWVQSPADANDPPQALGSDLTPRIFRSDNGTFSGTFTQVPLNANTYGTASNGNYIVFAGLTSDSLVIRTEDSFSGFNAAPINGIQFIPNSLKPVIELQPHQVPSGTLASGGSFTLNAFVSGPSLYYQWLKDGRNVPGASTNFYSATGITTGDSGDYKLVVTNAYGSVTSSVVSVTVSGEAAPSGAVVSPASINRGVGSTVIFSVTADGSEPFTHQWYDGATALAGETNATLTLSPVLAADAGSYTCAVTNSLGGTVSSAGVLTTFQPAGTTIAVNFMDYYSGASHDPVASTAFGIDPANWVNVDAGEQFIGSTTASGVAVSWSCKNTWSQTPSYSAYSAGGMAFLTGYLDDGVDGNNPFGPFVVVSNLSDVFGSYVVRVGSSVSDGSTGLLPITITNGPVNLTFTNPASGPFGVAIDNGSGGRYGLSTISPAMNHDTIRIQGHPGSNGVRGPIAGFIITDKPLIMSQPQGPSGTIYSGNTLAFTNLDAMGVPPLAYQWRKDGSHIPGATNATYSKPVASGDSGNYDMVITNLYGSVTSSVVAVSIADSAPLNVTVSPAAFTASVGGAVTFTVTADGSAPFAYQWYDGATLLAGKTNSTLPLTNLQTGNAGTYTCAVTNSLGGATSSPGTLTVNSSLPASAGINFGADQATVSGTAFGIDPANWFEAAGSSGSGSMNSLNISWSANDIWQQGASTPPGNSEVLYAYLDDPNPGASVTISGLAAMFPVYVVQTLGATDAGSSLEDVTINGSQNLGYPAPQPNGSGGLTSASTASTALYGDTVTIRGMTGLSGQARGGLAGVIITDRPLLENQPQAPTNIYAGTSFSLTGLNVVGVPPLSYQWQKDGTNIIGATDAVYTQLNATTNDVGNYKVVVTNAYGNVTSSIVSVSAVAAAPKVGVSVSGNNLTLDWSSGTLLEAANVTGPWTVNTNTSPYTVTPTGGQKFYRLLLQ